MSKVTHHTGTFTEEIRNRFKEKSLVTHQQEALQISKTLAFPVEFDKLLHHLLAIDLAGKEIVLNIIEKAMQSADPTDHAKLDHLLLHATGLEDDKLCAFAKKKGAVSNRGDTSIQDHDTPILTHITNDNSTKFSSKLRHQFDSLSTFNAPQTIAAAVSLSTKMVDMAEFTKMVDYFFSRRQRS